MFDTPARLGDCALADRDGLEGSLVEVEHDAVAAVAYRMRFNLHTFAQGFGKDGKQRLFAIDEQSLSVWRIAVGSQKGRPAGAQGTVDVELDAADCQLVTATLQGGTFRQ